MTRPSVLLMQYFVPLGCMASNMFRSVMRGAKQVCAEIVSSLSMITLYNWHAIIICNCVDLCSAMAYFSLLTLLMTCVSARLGLGFHWMESETTMIVSVHF